MAVMLLRLRSLTEVFATKPVREGVFTQIQGTKPQTLSYGLTDSPVGLLAWIIEKFHAWTDSRGNLESVLNKDELLTNVMIFWITRSIGSANRYYYEKSHHPTPEPSYVTTPTGFASFLNDITPPPRQFVERYFNVKRWTEMAGGGHFAALEVPEILAADIQAYFRDYREQ